MRDVVRCILQYEYGRLESKSWKVGHKLHRRRGPAYIGYHPCGSLRIKSWARNDQLFRIKGPSRIQYAKSGNMIHEEWIRGDYYYHNMNGPAHISYIYINGECWPESKYFICNVQVPDFTHIKSAENKGEAIIDYIRRHQSILPEKVREALYKRFRISRSVRENIKIMLGDIDV